MPTHSLAVIIPMYNEEPNAERCVRAVCAVLSAQVPSSRLVVVDDGSKDATAAILEKLGKEGLPLMVVKHERNKGYGAALMTGARAARKAGFEFGLYMDSDLTNDPELIPRFVEKVAEGRFDLVKASRYVRDGGMRGVPMRRRAITVLGNALARTLFAMGIRDCTNGFRAVRLDLICDVNFVENGFPIILEELLVLKQRGARATEIPYVLTARKASEGKSKFNYSAKMIYGYLKYALRAALVGKSR
jgi:dolichol-phosphate mannosyltransferase